MSLEDIRQIRKEKLERLREVFGNPFPETTKRTHSLSTVLKEYTKLSKRTKPLMVTGRIRALRGHGGATFFDIEEGDVQLQCFIKKDIVGEEMYNLFMETMDMGDFVAVSGTLFLTKKKERTLEVSAWKPLAKSIRPLPEKWHGIQDIEERFRRRSLDLLMNPDSRERFKKRRQLTKGIRDFLIGEGFEEVETPILQPLYGGALARPFTTHHNTLGEDLYLRIAPELYLKRLMVAGMTRVFEIGKNFRNEGIDVTHSPEFTELEGYMAYEDLSSLIAFLEQFFIAAASAVHGKKSFTFDGKVIEVKKPFKRMTFFDSIRRYAMLPRVESMSDEDLRLATKQLGIEVGRAVTRGKLLDEIFAKVVRRHLMQPTFVTHHPIDISPLAKASEDDSTVALRVQLIVGGYETINAYAELNDPIEQRRRMEEQEGMRKKGDAEVSGLDEDYLEVMEYGMPPTAGFGVGIDRLAQILTDTHNIRDVILFPLLRNKD